MKQSIMACCKGNKDCFISQKQCFISLNSLPFCSRCSRAP